MSEIIEPTTTSVAKEGAWPCSPWRMFVGICVFGVVVICLVSILLVNAALRPRPAPSVWLFDYNGEYITQGPVEKIRKDLSMGRVVVICPDKQKRQVFVIPYREIPEGTKVKLTLVETLADPQNAHFLLVRNE